MSNKKTKRQRKTVPANSQKPVSATKKVFNTAMAAAMVVQPFVNVAQAAEQIDNNVVRSDKSVIDFQNGVANIYAEQVGNETAINRFESFDVAPNNIANLYFKTEENGREADALLNFVQNRINVAGTVNALKDNQIGGDLYFISPEGMVLSSTGVINAGKLVVATPTEDYLEHMKAYKDNKKDFDFFNIAALFDRGVNIFNATPEQINKIINSAPADKLVGNMPINSSGTIAIEGTINVARMAEFMANKVDFNKDSLVRTAMDFSQIANVGEANQTSFDSDAKRLTLGKDEKGGIVIQGGSAINVREGATLDADKSKVVFESKRSANVVIKQDKGKYTKLLNYGSRKADAEINIDGTVIGGDMDITAEAKTDFKADVYDAAEEKKKDDKAAASNTSATKSNTTRIGTAYGEIDVDNNALGEELRDTILKKTGDKDLANDAQTFFMEMVTDQSTKDKKDTRTFKEKVNDALLKTKKGKAISEQILAYANAVNTVADVAEGRLDAKEIGELISDTIVNSKAGKALSDKAKSFFGKVHLLGDVSEGTAKINIGKTANINSSGSIKATATTIVNNELKITEQPILAKSGGKDAAKAVQKYYLAGAAATYNDSKSTAVINVDGNVTAAKDITMNAAATNKTTVATVIKKADGSEDASAFLNAAVNVVGHNTTAKVNLGREGQANNVISAGGDFKSEATTNTTMDINGTTAVDNRAVAATAVNIVGADTNAEVNVNTVVEGKNVTTNAKNKYDKLEITTNNGFEKPAEAKKDDKKTDAKTGAKADSKSTSAAKESRSLATVSIGGMSFSLEAAKQDDSAIAGLSELLGKGTDSKEISSGILAANKNADAKKGATSGDSQAVKAAKGITKTDKAADAKDAKGQKKASWNQYVDIGAAVMVENFDNKATVNIGKEGKLVAKGGDVTAKADIDTAKSKIKINNTVVNTSENTRLSAGAAVGIKNVHNDAAVVLADRQAGDEAIEAKSGAVTLDAHVTSQDEIAAQNAASTKLAAKKDDAKKDAKADKKDAKDAAKDAAKTDKKDAKDAAKDAAKTDKKDAKDTAKDAAKTDKKDAKDTEKTTKKNVVDINAIDDDDDSFINAITDDSSSINAIDDDGSDAKDAAKADKKDVKDTAKDAAKADKKDAKDTAKDTAKDAAKADKKDGKDAKAAENKKPSELPVSLSGTVVIENTTSNANVYVGKNSKISAQKTAALTAKVEGKDTMQAGKELKADKKDKTSPDGALMSGSQVGIGGTVGVQNAYLNSKVEIAKGAEIDAGHVDLGSDNTVTNTATSAGGSTSSKATIDGMVAYMGGESNSRVIVDKDAVLNGSVYGEGEEATDGVVSIKATNKTTLKDNTGVLDSSKGSALGAAVGVVSYDILAEAKVGDKNGAKGNGSISATDFKVDAINNSTINNKSAAGAAAGEAEQKADKGKDAAKKDGAKDDKSATKSVASAMDLQVRDKKSQGSDSKEKTVSLAKQKLTADGKSESAAKASLTDADTAIAKDAKGNADAQSKAKTEKQKKDAAHVNLDGAGSVSWNDVKTSAVAQVAGVTIKGKGEKAAIKVKAEDNTRIYANSGASALIRSGKNGDKGFSGNIAGAVGVNDITRTVDANITNVDIENMATISKKAESHNVLWASGKSAGDVQKAGSGVDIAISANVNYVDSHISNLMENVAANKNSNKKLKVENIAVDNDIQVAGSFSDEKTKNTVGLGAAVTIDKIKNVIDSRIIGSYLGNNQSDTSVTVLGITKLTQVGLAGSVGLDKGKAAKAGIHGAVAANTIKNDTIARIENSTIHANEENVKVATRDAALEQAAEVSAEKNRRELVEEGYDVILSKINDYLGNDASVSRDPNGNINVTIKSGAADNQGANTAGKTGAANTQGANGANKNGNAKTDDKVKFDEQKFVIKALENTGRGNRIITGAVSGTVTGEVADTVDKAITKVQTAMAGGNKDKDAKAADAGKNAGKDTAKTADAGKEAAKADKKDAKDIAKDAGKAADAGKDTTKTAASGKDAKKDEKAADKSGNGAAAAAVSYTDIEDNSSALITGSKIIANKVEVVSDTKTLMINAAAGGAVADGAKGIAAAGSVAIQNMKNTTESLIENSEITANKVDANVKNEAKTITAAGQANFDRGNAAVGMTWAQNDVENVTKAKILGTVINAKDAKTGVDVDARADNESKTWAIAASAGAAIGKSSGLAAEGSFAGNVGTNDTEAIIDKSSKNGRSIIRNARYVDAVANSATTQKAIAGNVSASNKNASIGGAVALNRLGTSGRHQSVKGQINNTDITTIGKDAIINDKAYDNDTIMTIAAGGAVKAGSKSGVNAQGSVTITDTHKDSTALMENTTIDAEDTFRRAKLMHVDIGSTRAVLSSDYLNNNTIGKALVNIDAQSNADITAAAAALGVNAGGKGAVNLQAGVSIVNMDGNTVAKAKNSKMFVKNLDAKAHADNKLMNIGVGLGVAASGNTAINAGGNVGVNTLNNNVEAKIEGSTIDSDENVVVKADNDSTLENYGGGLGVAAAKTAAIGAGATVAVNKIGGNTDARVEDSKITALGKGGSVTVTEYANDKKTGEVKGTKLQKKGLVVTADSKQDIHNVSLTGGVAAAGNVAVNVDATVGVNKISGHTNAKVLNTEINHRIDKNDAADVAVLAHDETSLRSVVGTGSVGIGANLGAAGAAAVDTNTISRDTIAEVDKQGIRGELNARSLSVKSASVVDGQLKEQGVSIGGGTVGVGLTGSVGVNNFTGSTKAIVNNMDITTKKDADIQAATNKKTDVAAGSYAAAVGDVAIGGAASVINVNDTSTTMASLSNSKVRSDGDVKVKANNIDVLGTQGISAAAALGVGGGIGVNVAVNSMKNTVLTNVENNDIEAKKGKADIDAENNMSLHSTNAAAGLGMVGAGVGVTINNVHSGATVNIDGSKVRAQDIDVRANEKRLLDAKGMGIGAGLAGITTNVNINNLGTALAKSYSYGKDGKETFDTDSVRTRVEEGLETADKAIARLAEMGYDEKDGSYKENLARDTAWTGKGSPAREAGITTNIINSSLVASRHNSLLTDATTDGDVDMKQGAFGAVGANVSVGITTVKNNNKVNISGSAIEGLQVDVKSRSDGNLEQEVQQGAAGGYAVNAALSRISRSGENQVNIDSSSIKAVRENGSRDDSNLTIKAEDAAAMNNEVKSATIGGVTGGAIVAKVQDGTNNTVNINDSKLSHIHKDGRRIEYKDIDLVADNKAKAVARAKTGSVGLISGNYAVADAVVGNKEHTEGITGVNIGKNNIIEAGNINIRNNNGATAFADTGSNGLGVATGGGATSTANVYATNRTTLGDGTVLVADKVSLDTRNIGDARVDAQGNSISLASIKENTATANLDNDVSVDIGKITLQRHDADGQIVNRGGDMTIIAQDASTNKADIKSMNVGGLYSKGTNVATTAINNRINVNINVDELAADNLTIKAGSKVQTITKAQSQSGGVAAINPQAAVVDNKVKTETNIRLSGKFDLKNDLDAEALNENDSKMLADAMAVTAVGVGGTAAANSADHTAHVDISRARITAGGKVTTGSRNNYSFGAADGGDYVIKGNGLGIIDVQVAQINNNIKEKSATDLGNVDSKGEQTYWADGTNKIGNNAYVFAAGAISGNAVNAAGLNMGVSNTINQHAGTNINSEKDITFAASSANTVENKAHAENSIGLASGVNSYVGNKINRTNVINIDGNVNSKGKINFFANRGADNESGSLDLNARSEVYNQAVISTGSTPTLDNKLSQSNRVNINGKVKADKDINYYANSGEEKLATYARKSTFMDDDLQDGYVATTDGESHVKEHVGKIIGGKETTDNQVVINGSVTAGKKGVQKVVIGDDNMVVLTKDEYNKVKEYYNAKHDRMPEKYTVVMADDDYEKLSQEDKDNTAFKKLSQVLQLLDADGNPVKDSDISAKDFKLSTYKYTEKLIKRADEVGKLMEQYKGTDAYYGYKAEYDSLNKILNNSCVMQRDASGKYFVAGDVNVKALELAPLYAEGADINVSTDNLSGTGSMTAYGNPDITVDNKSSLALNVKDIRVGKAGGNLYYNGQAVTSKGAVAMTNEDKNLTIGQLHVTDGRAGNINIIGRHTSSAVAGTDAIHYMEDGKEKTMPIMSDINVNGTLETKGGDLLIESKGDSINMENADVRARHQDFHAKKRYYQQYKDGLQNINGDPGEQFRDAYKGGYKATNGVESVRTQVNNSTKGMIMGDEIIINAADVNINGKIQSGFDAHYVNITEDTLLNADNTLSTSVFGGRRTVGSRIKEIHNNNKLTELSDSQVVGNAAYCVVAGGHIYNDAKGYYEEVIPVYYNPVTDKLITGDVESRGGSVSITGRILSTGDGNIYCLDGTGKIDVNNSFDKELVVGNLTTDHVEGKVTINDVSQKRSLEFTRGKDGKTDVKIFDLNDPDGKAYDTSSQGWNGQGYVTRSENGNEVYYNPVKGQRYSWTEGKTEDRTDYYERTTQSYWGIDKGDPTREKYDTKLDKSVVTDTRTKDKGYYVGVDEKNQNHVDDQMYVVHNYSKSDVSDKLLSHDVQVNGFLNTGRKHIWKNMESYTEDFSTTYSIKADNPVKIKFIGDVDGNSKTTISSRGDITLAGDVGNTHIYKDNAGIHEKGNVNITSYTGSIKQTNGSVYGDKVTLAAAGDMKNVVLSAGDEVKLNVSSLRSVNGKKQSRNADITVKGVYGSKGNVLLTGERELPDTKRFSEYKTMEMWNRSNPWMNSMTNRRNGTVSADAFVPADSITINTQGTQGDITTVGNAFLSANTINFMSDNGSIRANLKGGQLVNGFNANNASINAVAAKDIQLTQVEGDLLAGQILSYKGDVSLNTQKGGKVVSGITYKLDEDTEKSFLNDWRSMGMLQDSTSAADKAMLESKMKASGGQYRTWNKDDLLEAAAISSQNTNKATQVAKDVNVQADKVTINGVVQDEGKNADGINISLNGTTKKVRTYKQVNQQELEASKAQKDEDQNVVGNLSDGKVAVVDSDNNK